MQIQPEKGPLQPQPRNPVARSAPGVTEGHLEVRLGVGLLGLACWGSPSWSVLLRGTFRVLTVKWGLFGPSMGQFFALSGVSVFRLLLDVLFPWVRVG